MTRHGSLNSTTTHTALGTPVQVIVKHCGRCKNPFLSNPNCECGCHHTERLRKLWREVNEALDRNGGEDSPEYREAFSRWEALALIGKKL